MLQLINLFENLLISVDIAEKDKVRSRSTINNFCLSSKISKLSKIKDLKEIFYMSTLVAYFLN